MLHPIRKKARLTKKYRIADDTWCVLLDWKNLAGLDRVYQRFRSDKRIKTAKDHSFGPLTDDQFAIDSVKEG
jgi:hypothetical protein